VRHRQDKGVTAALLVSTWPQGWGVLHINRELIHHLAEVCLLRDLYLHTHQQTRREAS